MPAISAEIASPINDKSYSYVIDVGGDNVGARIIGRFNHLIEEGDYDMFCVVNGNREQTQTAKQVLDHIKSIEQSSGLKVTGLVNNTHLTRLTTVEDILQGQELVREVSKLSNIPIRYVTCLENIVDELPNDLEGNIFPIKLYMREGWM